MLYLQLYPQVAKNQLLQVLLLNYDFNCIFSYGPVVFYECMLTLKIS